MLNRRSLLQRAVALAGATLLAQKVPSSLAELDPDVVCYFDRNPTMDGVYLMDRCTIVPGDPSQNDPEWLQQEGNMLVLRDKTIQVADGVLTIPGRNTQRVIRDCYFDVRLHMESSGQPAIIVGNTFTNGFQILGVGTADSTDWVSASASQVAEKQRKLELLYEFATGLPFPTDEGIL